jgi:serine/threonine-protein kinase
MTRTGDVRGTAEFLCRKQVINFKRAGPEVDVWAAAASLYFMLTAATPRDFPDDRDPWLTVLETDPLPIRRRRPELPAGLAEVIDRALADATGLHFQSARQFREALEDAL